MQLRTKPSRSAPRNAGGLRARALGIEELRALLAPHEAPCISLYLPSRRGGTPEDKNRFQALLKEARLLLSKTHKKSALDALLDPLLALDKPAFWQEQTEGLALFASADHTALYRLPVTVPEQLFVADTFHVRPLLDFLGTNQHYYLLTLSQGQVAFFKGNLTGLVHIDLAELPRSLEEALGPAEKERQKTMHQSARGSARTITSGTSVSDSSRDEDMARFYRQVDAAVFRALRDEKAPLVLAGAERDVHVYQRVNRYPGLARESVDGNLAKASTAELHQRAWPVVQSLVAEQEQVVIDRYQQLVSKARALDEIRAIAQFAIAGRVSELMLDKDAALYGKMDRANGSLELHGSKSSAAEEDVLDDIAEAVLLRGGEVYSLPKKRMPTKSPIAATLRW